MNSRDSKGCMYSIMKIIVLLLLVVTLQSCQSTNNELWATKCKKPGVGKVTKMKRGWGTNSICNTYAGTVYIKSTTYKRYYYWRNRR